MITAHYLTRQNEKPPHALGPESDPEAQDGTE